MVKSEKVTKNEYDSRMVDNPKDEENLEKVLGEFRQMGIDDNSLNSIDSMYELVTKLVNSNITAMMETFFLRMVESANEIKKDENIKKNIKNSAMATVLASTFCTFIINTLNLIESEFGEEYKEVIKKDLIILLEKNVKTGKFMVPRTI